MATDPKEATDPFNISDFDEEAERARLRPVDEAGLSDVTQKDFTRWIARIRRSLNMEGQFRPVPEKLFFANQDGSKVTRTYQKHPTRMKNPRDELLAEIQLGKSEDGLDGALFERWGEKPNFSSGHMESFSAHFSPIPTEGRMAELTKDVSLDVRDAVDKLFAGVEYTKAGDKPDFGLVIRANTEGRELYIQYDRGKIITIGFELDDDNQSSRLHVSDRPMPDLVGVELNLKTLLAKGRVTGKVRKNIVYELTYDKDEDREQTSIITLTNRQRGIVTDQVLIPATVKAKDKFEELFPKPLLENPYDAGTEWDQKWKAADLETFGIKWDRPTPNPVAGK